LINSPQLQHPCLAAADSFLRQQQSSGSGWDARFKLKRPSGVALHVCFSVLARFTAARRTVRGTYACDRCGQQLQAGVMIAFAFPSDYADLDEVFDRGSHRLRALHGAMRGGCE
jgi:hypothetical protein